MRSNLGQLIESAIAGNYINGGIRCKVYLYIEKSILLYIVVKK